MASSPSTRTKVFISYSNADKKWLERLKRHLKPLIREGYLDCWDDAHIRPGDDWQQEIRTALDTAQAAVLLISADFFASERTAAFISCAGSAPRGMIPPPNIRRWGGVNGNPFDVFLGYSRAGQAAVKRVARARHAHGLGSSSTADISSPLAVRGPRHSGQLV